MKKLEGNFLPPRSGKAKQVVIFLHGYGANGDDLLSIGEEWGRELPDAVFLSPNAPDVARAKGQLAEIEKLAASGQQNK